MRDRSMWIWGVMLAAAVIGREAIDWRFSPSDNFYARSLVSTWIAVAIFASAGLWSAWRSRSIAAGAIAGITTGAISAIIVTIGSLVQLAIWHDPHTMRMIAASGGLGEVFALPLIVIVPGTLCALVGGVFGRGAAAVFRSQTAE